MSLICDYCSNKFGSKSAITVHKKTAKYCLDIQGKIRQNSVNFIQDIDVDNYECEYCGKNYKFKGNLTRHEFICKRVTNSEKCETLIETIQGLKNIINCKDEQIAYLKQQLDNKDALSQQIALAAIAKPTNTNTMIKKQIINNLKPLTETEMSEHIPMLTIDHVKQGGAGYARFAMDYPFKDRIAISDKARKKLAYKDADGNIVYDNEGKQLSEKLFKVLKDKNELVFKEILNDLNFKIEEAQYRDNFDEAEVIIDLTEKIRTWKKQANAAGDGIYNDLTSEFTKALCKISTS